MSRHIHHAIRPEIAELQAYHVPPPGDMVKLDAMENPYCWPENIQQAWLNVMAQTPLNRYPSADPTQLKAMIQQTMHVPAGKSLMLGNGSDELIQIIALACAKPGACLLAPEPGFAMYKLIATYAGITYVGVPLTRQYELDMPKMREAINEHQPAVTFLAYPNNPTGNLFNPTDIHEVIQISPGAVVLDEAYHPFANSSFMDALSTYEHLLVMRTFSKMGLAGLRLGLLCGDNTWVEQFEKLRMPYNLSTLTQASALFALQHHDVFAKQAEHICKNREHLLAELKTMSGITLFPSAANFVLFKVAQEQSQVVFNQLLEQKILIRNLGTAPGLLKDCLRVTVGNDDENHAFLSALRGILSELF